MQAGRLYHTVNIYKREVVVDSFGASKERYTKLMTNRAYINRRAGAEGVEELERFNGEQVTIHMHGYIGGMIDHQCRVEIDDIMYDIEYIYNSRYPRRTEITLRKVNN